MGASKNKLKFDVEEKEYSHAEPLMGINEKKIGGGENESKQGSEKVTNKSGIKRFFGK